MKICPNCNSENYDEALFCTKCGSNITAINNAPKSVVFQNVPNSTQGVNEFRCPQPGVLSNQNPASNHIPNPVPNAIPNPNPVPDSFTNPNQYQPSIPEEDYYSPPPNNFVKACNAVGEIIKKSVFFKKKKNTVITFSSLLAVVVIVFAIINSGHVMFMSAYDSGDFEKAREIQNRSINPSGVKDKIHKFILNEMDIYYNEYYNEKITYDEFKTKFGNAKKFGSNTDLELKADRISKSREAFKKATELRSNGDIYNAILEFNKVIDEDSYRDYAKHNISELKPQMLDIVISKLEACASVNDFNGGMALIEEINSIFPSNSTIESYKEDFKKREHKHKAQLAYIEQDIKIIDAYTVSNGRGANTKDATVIIKNDSDKIIKNAIVVLLLFDSNGNPVSYGDANYSEFLTSNSLRCNTKEINLNPGQSFGRGYGWAIPLNVAKVKACVKSAEFTDGTTWINNRYYNDYWLTDERDSY